MTDLRKIIADWREHGTPGPWRRSNKYTAGFVASADGEALVANTHSGQRSERREEQIREQYANRDLIAAAPDMAERIEALEAALKRIVQWSEAYPTQVFPEPDFKRAAAVLSRAGMTLDAISASNMRHVTKGVGEIARAALDGEGADD